MSTPNPKPAGAERRNYLRMQDEVILRYRLLPTAEDGAAACCEQVDRFTLAAGFLARTQSLRPLWQSIHNQSPEIAKYLSALDEKLNQIAQLFMLQELEGEASPCREVNLGAGGLGFDSSQPLPVGAVLEVRMVLPASLLGLIALARVLRCEPREGGTYWTAVEFTEIREQDRDLLVRHLLNRQLEARRQAHG